MSPTLEHGESVFVTRTDFPWNRLKRGDIVLLQRPRPGEGVYNKRIVGLPGEEIKMAADRVYADDLILPEDYLALEGDAGHEMLMIKARQSCTAGNPAGWTAGLGLVDWRESTLDSASTRRRRSRERLP